MEIIQLALGRAEQSACPRAGSQGGSRRGSGEAPGARWRTRRQGIFAAPRCAHAGSGYRLHRRPREWGDGEVVLPACQLCPCHRTLVGGKPHKTGAAAFSRADEGSSPPSRRGAELGCRSLSSPPHLKFAWSSLTGPEFIPTGATDARATAAAGEAGSAVFVPNVPQEARSNLLKPRRCREAGRRCPGLGRGARGGLACIPLPSGLAGARPASASCRRMWPLGRSRAPDWLTFQCHSGGVSTSQSPLPPQLRVLGTGVIPARLSSAVQPSLQTRAPSPGPPPCSPRHTGHHLFAWTTC